MDRRVLLQAGLCSALIASLGACAAPYVYRYRLRIFVQVDGRVYDGSSVIETSIVDRRNYSSWLPPEAPRIVGHARGEAVEVDLGAHGVLFGLLWAGVGVPSPNGRHFSAQHPYDALPQLMGLPHGGNPPTQNLEIPATHWPVFVRFADIRDPESVELVLPDQFAKIYGAGAAVLRITLSVTQDEITNNIDRRLPWLKGIKGNLSNKPWPRRYGAEPSLSQRLDRSSFKM